MKTLIMYLSASTMTGLLWGCSPGAEPAETSGPVLDQPIETSTPPLSVNFEKFQLDNGLEVILHVDKSDPVVAINLAVHVGSAREIAGRTGFAHLFEHLLFLDSENLGYSGLEDMNTRIGGDGTNGFTTNDMTQYFQTVPADALEKVIWAEADKLGYFIKTVTQPVIDKEKQVVKNEKRQRNDNQPYGHTFSVVGEALYPDSHPYSWSVIGSLDHLEAATLQDVKDFYGRWYVPNNTTVTIAGDFDPAEARQLVEKYFGDIPRGEDVVSEAPKPAALTETVSLFHEDNFATVPRLTLVWPTVEEYHPDRYALEILAEYLTVGKRAPLNAALIDEEKLTSSVSAFHFGKELAGEFYLFIDAAADGDLDAFPPALRRAFARFEEEGISESDLDRIKAGREVQFYNGIQSALGKAIQLSEYNIFTNDPSYFSKEISAAQSVTAADVVRVYETYLKGKPHIATSFVPKGKLELALGNATRADVTIEPIVQGAETSVEFDPRARTFEPTYSSFDRTEEPTFGTPYKLPSPDVWRAVLSNGIAIYGIESSETPLVYFSLAIDAGRERGSAAKPAVANLTADMLLKGTANKTTAELEDAIKSLGSSISISAGTDGTFITGNALARNFDATIAILEEMLLEPRWDTDEFKLLIRERQDQLDSDAGNPNAIAARETARLAYPEDHILSYPAYGTKEKLQDVTLADLEQFYALNFAPENATLRVVGDIDADAVTKTFSTLSARWNRKAASPPVTLPPSNAVDASSIYFYDVPGASQSVFRITRPSLSATDPDYPLAEAVNFLLGDIYTSELNTELRINQGYTYGIGSRFIGGDDRGSFTVFTSVRSNVTMEALASIKDIISNFGPDFSQEDLDTLKEALLKGQALKTETPGAKLGVLGDISTYGYPDDYLARNLERVQAMTLEEFKTIAERYLRTDAMNWIIVGDAQTQADRLTDLGFGPPVMLAPTQ